MEYKASRWRQFAAAFAASLLTLSAGMALGWSSPTRRHFIEGTEGFKITEDEASTMSSAIAVGAFLGCFPAGFLTDFFGRRKILLIMAGPFSISWALLMFSKGVWSLYLGRFIAGITIGTISVATPTYINEISTPNLRGTLGTLYQLQLVIGATSMYLIGLLKTVFTMTLICSIVPSLFTVLFFWMPESPNWHLIKGRKEECRKALMWLRGPGFNVENEINEKIGRSPGVEDAKAGFLSIFRDRVSKKAISFILVMMLVQQLCGINALVFYAYDIISLSRSSIDGGTGSILIGCLAIPATGLSAILMDLTGRRALLLVSAVGMGLCLACLGTYEMLKISSMGWLPLLCLGIYNIVFSLGFGPVPWVMMTELFTERLKASASTVGASVSWGLAFLVTKFFMAASNLFGMGAVLWFFACVCVLGALFTNFFLIETKGKTSEEILVALGTKSNTNDSPEMEDIAI